MDIKADNESLEESIFKTLSNQKRRDILRYIGERRQFTFTEIKRAVEIEDSSSLSYHLNSLQTLIAQKDEKYMLSDLGQEAYSLIMKTNAYTSTNIVVNILQRQLTLLIIANAILWLAAILAAREFGETLTHNTTFNLIILWLTSNALIHFILKGTNREKRFNRH